MNTKAILCGALSVIAIVAGAGSALADDATCRAIRMSDPNWTDINATNGVASVVLEALGYAPEISFLSVPIGYESMKNGEIDVFLGNWMPAQTAFIEDLQAADAIEVLNTNLTGAKFTLAVPSYMADQGITSFADLDANAEAFDSKIYGIEPGAPANQNIARMIAADDFGLGDWELVESGEQAMLAQVSRMERSEDGIVFLAWAPHPMNTNHDITYLEGGDEYFGPNFGGAEVRTLARKGWPEACPNAAQLFTNMTFDIEMENTLMGEILDGADAKDAAKEWLAANPDALTPWLDGVTTLEGEPAEPAVRAALGL
ncbi:choline ABC transporter substrate-binding protein [Paracoccus rhizosphaerae]|uniref:Choline ABC transporter substrate-binding protein n=1 Tax=Paracoccus rhizosphaerae TaxID=1133347 RepID=A0ABV6CMD8_9RHOB|nr:choline ABC transporter substrate-binding protein [Paracoccus rhizosphaerae]